MKHTINQQGNSFMWYYDSILYYAKKTWLIKHKTHKKWLSLVYASSQFFCCLTNTGILKLCYVVTNKDNTNLKLFCSALFLCNIFVHNYQISISTRQVQLYITLIHKHWIWEKLSPFSWHSPQLYVKYLKCKDSNTMKALGTCMYIQLISSACKRNENDTFSLQGTNEMLT